MNNRQTSKINYFILSLFYIANIEDTGCSLKQNTEHHNGDLNILFKIKFYSF